MLNKILATLLAGMVLVLAGCNTNSTIAQEERAGVTIGEAVDDSAHGSRL